MKKELLKYQIEGARRLQRFRHDLHSVLYPYQKEGVYLLEKFDGKALLADEMGLGKTIQALVYLLTHPELRPAVIICPASVKWVWSSQAKEHCGLRSTVCQGERAPRRKGLFKSTGIYIINYDILLSWSLYLRSLHPKVVILDECHYIKSRGIWRTKAVRKLCSPIRRLPLDQLTLPNQVQRALHKDDWVTFEDRDGTPMEGFINSVQEDTATVKTQIPHLIALSGTPLTNRPEELWTTLNLLWPQVFPAFIPFAWEFCEPQLTHYGWKYNGASNLDVLHQRLRRLGMIRRRKKDVLRDLPGKQRFVVPLDIRNRKDYTEAETDIVRWLKKSSAAKAERAKKAEKIVRLGHLRRLAATGKLQAVFNWVDSFLEESESKLVVGALHHDVINAIHKHYRKSSVTFTGKTSLHHRRIALRLFQKNPLIRIIIGQIKAIGTGVDGLQHTSHTSAVVEIPWDPGTCSQFDDRIHRIGQKEAVNIYYLVAQGTIEEDLCQIIQRKQDILTKTLDGEENLQSMRLDIFDRLEQELKKRNRRE